MLLAALVSFALFAQTADAPPGRVVTLSLPKAPVTGKAFWVELKLGAIERGKEIEIATTAGKSLGVISPFGIRSGAQAGTYIVPLPAEVISNKRVTLRLTVNQYGHAKRAPTVKEVKGIRLRITPQS
jgi:hypothetical protein